MTERTVPTTRLDELVYDAERKARMTGEHLKHECRQLIDRLERTIAAVDAGQQVNSLGVVQSSGLDVDRTCTLYQERHEFLAELRWASRPEDES